MTSGPRVAIAGCGQVGHRLVRRLHDAGCVVAVVDRDGAAIADLPGAVRQRSQVADLLDPSAWRRLAGAPFEAVVATTPADELNAAAVLTCRAAVGTTRLLARMEDPSRERTWRFLGIEGVVPLALAAGPILRLAWAGPRRRGIMESLRIVVMGCGRLGSHLANLLSAAGHHIVVVDRNEAAFDNLSPERFSGFRIAGDASEPAVLRQAGLDRADILIAATREDNLNLMVALVARQVFGVRQVMARVYDPAREAVYREQGVATVCPTTMAAEEFYRLVYRAEAAGGEAG